MGPPGTRWPSHAGWPSASWRRPSTTRSCCPTGGWRPTATSTAPPWRSRSTSSPSRPRRSGPSPSGAPTACSTWPGRTGSPPSWPTIRGSIPGSCSPTTPRRRWSPRTGGSPLPPASTRCPPRPCRRITCRWAGVPLASCGRWSTTWGASSPSSWWPGRGPSTCARRCGRRPRPARCGTRYGRARSAAAAPTGTSRPSWRPPPRWSGPGQSPRRRKRTPANWPEDPKGARDVEGHRVVRAPRGAELSCKGWAQEAALRMLMNNLDPEVAERPDDLVVYGGTGRAARSWAAFDAIVASLRILEDDETLLVQSGKPVGVFRTHEWAPRVLIANANLVGDWANWPEFRRLEQLGLTMYGQMTAGSWIYIGTQGILQGTYQCFAAIAAQRFGGSLAGTLTLTSGLGGMGGAQPLAVSMNGGGALCVEGDPGRGHRRLQNPHP